MKLPWTILWLTCALLTAGGVTAAYADPPASPIKESIGTAVLRGSYASTVLIQVLDAHTTRQVISMGGRERNPLLKPFAGNSAALYSVKAGMAAAFVVSERSIARNHKFAAIAVAAAINAAYLITARHNMRVLGQMRAQHAGAR